MFQKKGRADKFCRRWRAILGEAISGKPGGGRGYSRRWEWLTPARLWSAYRFAGAPTSVDPALLSRGKAREASAREAERRQEDE